MGDVLEYLVDGTSGLSPGDVAGSAIVCGVCSAGTVGKGYLLGKSSDLEDLLGYGPLVDKLRDVFATAGQSAVVVAVPVEGQSAGYIGALTHEGDGPDADVSGTAAANADVVVEIVDAGALGTGTYKLSTDGGDSWGSTTAVPANGQIAVGDTGTTLVIEDAALVSGDTYAYIVRNALGPVSKVGTGPDVEVSGTPLAAAQVELVIQSSGGRNEGTYTLSLDGGDTVSVEKTLPVDGAIAVGDTGVSITWPDEDAVVGDTYTFDLLAPIPNITSVAAALETPLELYDVEFVYVVGETDSVDWTALGVIADENWNAHKPRYFVCETRMPRDDEDVSDWAAALIQDRDGMTHRFVLAVAAYGEVSDSTGQSKTRNWGGLFSGRVLSIPVQRAPGRVRDGGITQGTLPEGWTEAVQQMLETAGFVTARTYAGLEAPYWGDAKTLAEDTSDYIYLPVVRTAFKAVRLMRLAALMSMYDEAGDPTQEGGGTGLVYLQARLETALNSMVAAVPAELVSYVVEIPSGQDIVNNGVATETTLIGIPIIRKIKLFSRYVYAGGAFDPRLEG